MRVFFASKHIKSIRMRVVLAQSIATAQEHDESEKTVDTEQKKQRICMRCGWRWWEMGWRSGDEKKQIFFQKFFSFYFLHVKQTDYFIFVSLIFFSLALLEKYFSAANCRNKQRRHFTKDEENLKCSVWLWLCQSVEREQSEVVAAKSALKRMPHSPCASFTL